MFVIGLGFAKFTGTDSTVYWWQKVQMDVCNFAWQNLRKTLPSKERILLYWVQFNTDTIHVVTSKGRKLKRAFTWQDFLGSASIKETLDITMGYTQEPEGYEIPQEIANLWTQSGLEIMQNNSKW